MQIIERFDIQPSRDDDGRYAYALPVVRLRSGESIDLDFDEHTGGCTVLVYGAQQPQTKRRTGHEKAAMSDFTPVSSEAPTVILGVPEALQEDAWKIATSEENTDNGENG